MQRVEKYLGESEGRIPLAEILKIPDEDFPSAQENFLGGVKVFFEYLKRSIQEKGVCSFLQPHIMEEMLETPRVYEDANRVNFVTV